MAVGDFEREFMAAAGTQGIDLEPAARLSWLSGLGHAEPEAESAPPAVLEQLAALHNALGGSYEFLGKRRHELPVDFTLSGRVVVELDEFQYFTSLRLTSLDYYDDFDHDLDIPQYRRLCSPRTRRMESRRAGPNRRGAGLCRHGDDPTVRGPGSVDDRDGQRNAVHLPTLPQPTRRTWDRPSERRIPRSRVSGVHRVMVRAVQEACRLARRVGNDRSSKEKHRQLCERIPSAAPLRARLPDTRRGGPHLADTQQPSDLKPTTNQGSTSAH